MGARTPTSKIAVGVSLVVVLAMLALAAYSPLSAFVSGPVLLLAGVGCLGDRSRRVDEGANLVLTVAGTGLIGAAVLVTLVLVRW